MRAGIAGTLVVCMTACAAPERVALQADGLTPRARGVLDAAMESHRRLFGVQPRSLKIRVFDDPEHPEFSYDAFDHEQSRIEMHWPEDDPDYGEWTLVHELAHAYQFALDAEAYVAEPSWIHEGLAEYAAWRFYRRRDGAEAASFLREQARRYLRRSRPFDEVLDDVYAGSWRRNYPACHLAVHVLGPEVALEYFRCSERRGEGDPREALRLATGLDRTELATRIDSLARELEVGIERTLANEPAGGVQPDPHHEIRCPRGA